jgi:hypothetical protein
MITYGGAAIQLHMYLVTLYLHHCNPLLHIKGQKSHFEIMTSLNMHAVNFDSTKKTTTFVLYNIH